jgi:hypothetical protein
MQCIYRLLKHSHACPGPIVAGHIDSKGYSVFYMRQSHTRQYKERRIGFMQACQDQDMTVNTVTCQDVDVVNAAEA